MLIDERKPRGMSDTDSPGKRDGIGGGTGGGPEGGGHAESIEGTFDLAANRINLCARPPLPPAVPAKCVVTILSTGTGADGLVDVRGSQGVRVTAGPPPALPTDSSAANGVEVVVGQTGCLTLQRGLLPSDQKVELTPTGITIDAGAMGVTIKSLSSIELSVAGGLTKLRLGPEGVTVEAVTIKLSATLLAEIKGVMNTISATGINKIGGPMTMIG
jgi:hypothetical protein